MYSTVSKPTSALLVKQIRSVTVLQYFCINWERNPVGLVKPEQGRIFIFQRESTLNAKIGNYVTLPIEISKP